MSRCRSDVVAVGGRSLRLRRRRVGFASSLLPLCLAMFTGLVEGVGTVAGFAREAAEELRLTIAVPSALADADVGSACQIGDSIAINGCCLTIVESQADGRWVFQAGSETLSKTNLGRLQHGDSVNLERALPANGRFGGHIVQGHVDGTATVSSIERQGDWTNLWFELNATLASGLVPKGSIAVDGVSLTVVEAVPAAFSVALIPHTLESTTLGCRRVGDVVNIETDILGKYVQRLLAGVSSDGRG